MSTPVLRYGPADLERIGRERVAQGLPPTIEDAATLERIADIISKVPAAANDGQEPNRAGR